MPEDKNDREASLLKALEAAGTAVTEAARYSMQVINQSGDVAVAAPAVVEVSPPTSPFDTRQWNDSEATKAQSESYYLHFKPGGAGNPTGQGAKNNDLGRLYAFLFTQEDPATNTPSYDLWIRWQTRIHNELAPLLEASSPNGETIQELVTNINTWLREQINAFGDPDFQDLTVDLSVAQYVVLSHAIVTQKEHKLLSPWGKTLETQPQMFW